MIRGIFRISFAIGILAVTWLSLMPKEALPPTEVSDKLIHVVAYAALALSGGLGVWGWRTWLLIGAGLFALGGVLEVAQVAVPGRTASMFDAFANGLGIALGLSGAWIANLLMGSSLRR